MPWGTRRRVCQLSVLAINFATMKEPTPWPDREPSTSPVDAAEFASELESVLAAIGKPAWQGFPASVPDEIETDSAASTSSSASPAIGDDDAVAGRAGACLRTPIDFPGIDQAIVPGDHVALAVDPNVPQLAAVLSGLVAAIGNCQAGRISVLLWDEADVELVAQLQTRLSAATSVELEISIHRPNDRGSMRHIAVDAMDEPVYLAKDLVDADLTIPVLVARRADALGSSDPEGILPMFADAQTRLRIVAAPDGDPSAVIASNVSLLGIQLAVMVSASGDGRIGHILAGPPRRLRQLAMGSLGPAERPRCELVVATLRRDSQRQTWANLTRAALAASRELDDGGNIVVWSDLSSPPDAVWQRSLYDRNPADDQDEDGRDDDDESASHDSAVHEASTKAAATPPMADLLAELLRRHHVWLRSELDSQLVEDLGMAVLHAPAELAHLAAGSKSSGVLHIAGLHGESFPHLSPVTLEPPPHD